MPRALLKRMVEAGYDGRRNGKRWHAYDSE